MLRPSAARPKPLYGIVYHIDIEHSSHLRTVSLGRNSTHWRKQVLFPSPWASPLHLVPKKDGSWCHYCRLYAVTVPDR